MAIRRDNGRMERNYDRSRDRNRDFDGNYDRQQQQFEARGYDDYDARYDQQGDYGDNYRQTDNDYGRDDFVNVQDRRYVEDRDYDRNRTSGRRNNGVYKSNEAYPNQHRGANYDDRGARYDGSAGGRQGFGSFNSNDYGGRDFVAGPGGSYGQSNYGASGGAYAGTMGHNGYRDDNDNRGWFDDDRDHRGRGPANYKRSDERILEDACDRLTDDWGVDASDITVTVQDAEITLDGTVNDRRGKRRAEDCVHDISSVKHVQNNLRINDMDRDADYDRTRTVDKTRIS